MEAKEVSPKVIQAFQAESRTYRKDWLEAAIASAITAYEKEQGEVVVSKVNGQIVDVTRQDEDGRILSIIDESNPTPDRKVHTLNVEGNVTDKDVAAVKHAIENADGNGSTGVDGLTMGGSFPGIF